MMEFSDLESICLQLEKVEEFIETIKLTFLGLFWKVSNY